MTGSALAARLTREGLDQIEAARKQVLSDLALERFSHETGTAPAVALWVPGRLEVFGKHTDYAGGHSLVAPVPRGFVFVASVRPDRVVRMTDAVRREQFTVDLDGPQGAAGPSQPAGWRRYAATTVQRLRRNFPDALRGADIVFGSDLPPASGMSSSSALMVGLASILVRLAGIETRTDWQSSIDGAAGAAGYYACIENGLTFGALTGDAGVGTHGGSEDHVALICGRAGYVSAWRFVPIHHLAGAAIPAEWMFVIASSGVAARKTGAAKDAYNRLSLLARTLLDLWNGAEPPQPSLRAALTSAPGAADRLRALVRARSASEPANADLERRLTHFLNEDARVVQALHACQESDRPRIGALADASQADAEVLLQNQVAETVALTASARALGAFGASSFGAGFGGSVWALVLKADAADFAARWVADYRREFPARETATVFIAPPGPPVTWLD